MGIGFPALCPPAVRGEFSEKYARLSHQENLTLEGRRGLRELLRLNRRLNVAHLLKESFGQLWDYQREGWARKFSENWKAALK